MGHGTHNSGGPQYRYAIQNTQPSIQSFLRQFPTSGHKYFRADGTPPAVFPQNILNCFGYHFAGTRINCRLTRRYFESRFGDTTHAPSATNDDFRTPTGFFPGFGSCQHYPRTDFSFVGDIRGRGLFRGLEIVRDRYSREPFDPNLGVNKKIKRSAFDAGLICYPMGGTIDGRRGDHVLLAPPFIISDDQVDELVDKLATAVDAATG